MAYGEIYRGEEILYLVEIADETGAKLVRPFDQTGGNTSISTDEIDIDTKDRSGSAHGRVTQTISLEGNLTEGDPFPKAMLTMVRQKEYARIYEVDTRTNEAEVGAYMVTTFDREFSNGDNATYTLDATLFGDVQAIKLEEIPEGAPALVGEEDNGTGNGTDD